MLILTFFCWLFTSIVWLVCAITKFDRQVRPLFWVGLYVFAAGCIPLFGE